MAENLISKIKVGNTEYGLETTIANVNGLQDSLDNKISYIEQNLNDTQKAQARANIGIVQSDWNQSDESQPDAILNKPFGYTEVPVESIQWDGVALNGLLTGTSEDAYRYYRISNSILNTDDLANGGKVSILRDTLVTTMHTVGSLIAAGAALALSSKANVGDAYVSITGGGSYSLAKNDTLYIGTATYIVAEDAKFSGGDADVYVVGGVVENHSSGSSVKYKGGKNETQYEITTRDIVETEHEFTSSDVTDIGGALVLSVSNVSACVFVQSVGTYTITNNSTSTNISFPKTGLYLIANKDLYTTALSVNGYEMFMKIETMLLEDKYIPDTIVRKTDIAQPDWAETDSTNPGFIKNKPIIDKTLAISGAAAEAAETGKKIDQIGNMAMCALPGAIHWDGYIGDKTVVTVPGETMGFFVHLTEQGSPAMMGGEYLINMVFGGFYGLMLNSELTEENLIGTVLDNGIVAFGEFVLYVPQPNLSFDGVVFPKKGFYSMYMTLGGIPLLYTASIMNPIMPFHEPDDDEVHFAKKEEISGTINLGDTITWNGTTANQEVYPGPGGLSMVRLADCTLTSEELATMTITGSVTLPDGTTVENLTGIVDGDGSISIISMTGYSNSNVAVAHKDNASIEGTTFKKRGFYAIDFGDGYISSLTITPYNFIRDEFKTNTYLKNEHLEILDINHHTNETHVGETLKWDGEIEGREFVHETVNIPEMGVSGDIYFVRVSSSIPTYEQILAMVESGEAKESIYNHSINGTEEKIITSENIFSDNTGISIGETTFITYEDNIVIENEGINATLPHAGIYFIKQQIYGFSTYSASLTLPGYDFIEVTTTQTVKVNEAYLPSPDWNKIENRPFGDMPTGSDTLAWDGTLDGYYYVAQEGEGRTTYYVCIAEVVPTLAELQQGGIIAAYDGTDSVAFTADDVGEDESGLIVIIAMGSNEQGVPLMQAFIVVPNAGISLDSIPFGKAGIYTMAWSDNASYGVRITINNYTGFSSVKKIDPKYLPNYTASEVGAGTFAGQVIANSSSQAASTSLIRNSKLVSTDTNPTVNGEIYWTYA